MSRKPLLGVVGLDILGLFAFVGVSLFRILNAGFPSAALLGLFILSGLIIASFGMLDYYILAGSWLAWVARTGLTWLNAALALLSLNLLGLGLNGVLLLLLYAGKDHCAT